MKCNYFILWDGEDNIIFEEFGKKYFTNRFSEIVIVDSLREIQGNNQCESPSEISGFCSILSINSIMAFFCSSQFKHQFI